MLKHLNPSMGFGRVYGEWVLALWQSRNGDYILWKDRVPSIHSSCIWFNFFPHFILCTIFFSLYPSLLLLSFCLTSFIWSTLNAWMSYLYMCSCISAHIVGMQRAYEQIYSIMLISIQVYGNYIYISSGVDSVCVCVCWFSRWTGGKHSVPRDLQQYYWQYGHNHLDATKVFNHVQDLSFNEWIHDFFKCISCLNKEMDGFMYS